MKKQYIIVDQKKNKHLKKCFGDILNIKDNRPVIDSCSVVSDNNKLFACEISNRFLEQLTEQISGEIFNTLNRKKDRRTYLSLRDSYIVQMETTKYIWVTLFWNNTIGEVDLWVKFWSKNGQEELNDDSDLIFKICNREESKICDKIRFGKEFKFWAEQINIYFDLFSKETKKEIRKKRPSNYPDTIINCHFSRDIDQNLRQQLYLSLKNYISNFNDNFKNEFKIHDFFLLENNSNEIISVFIDFGNCEPSVLDELLQCLLKSNLGIIEFSFN
jgi:hypothetical protein